MNLNSGDYIWREEIGVAYSGGEGDYDFFAEGDRGQVIYISPQNNMLIIRNGFEYGVPSFDWVGAFYQFATEFNQ